MENNNALLERFRMGDKTAQDKIVEANVGLVWSVVKRFSGRGYEAEDLFQIGAIGLIKAVQKFNPEFNVQLSTYAVPMIMGEIRRFLRDDGPIKISRSLKERAMKGRRCEEILRRRLGREPTVTEISNESGICIDELLEAFSAANPPESIFENVGEHDNLVVGDKLGSVSYEEEIVNKVLLNEILSKLTPRERQVIVLRYYKGKTQSQIAKIIGVSQVQVSRIEKNTLEKIRNTSFIEKI